jgi:Putative Sin3 binding protein
MAPPAISALGMALNAKSASVNIPKPRDGIATWDNFTAVPANQKHHGEMLLTPPNSISPNLPPHGHRGARKGQPSDSTNGPDSDIDLHDVQEEPQSNALSAEALDRLGDLDSAGTITPSLLAKHHLPDILLSHGPLAIRHIMGYLTTSVPGFSRITSAKARRLVVAALEGRGSGTEGGGIRGDVLFEKVGWGRWDARMKGQPQRDRPSGTITPPGSLPSSYSHGLQVPRQPSLHSGSERLGTSMTANSAVFSHSEADYEDQDMLELEADKMSLDGNEEAYASSEAPELLDEDMGEGDVTDEEDWASIGAQALRARSLPKSPRIQPAGGRIYQPIGSYAIASRYRSRTPGYLAQSAPARRNSGYTQPKPFSTQHDAGVNSSSERAAIEALLSMGNM